MCLVISQRSAYQYIIIIILHVPPRFTSHRCVWSSVKGVHTSISASSSYMCPHDSPLIDVFGHQSKECIPVYHHHHLTCAPTIHLSQMCLVISQRSAYQYIIIIILHVPPRFTSHRCVWSSVKGVHTSISASSSYMCPHDSPLIDVLGHQSGRVQKLPWYLPGLGHHI